MDAYTFSLALGGIGLLVMAVSGLGHRMHPGGHHVGHGHGHGHTHGHGVVKAGGKVHVGIAKVSRAFLTVLSPRVAFSLLVGFGATGFLLKSVFGGAIL